MTREELNKVLEKHSKWLNGKDGGERAMLKGANLSRLNLNRADLREADLSDVKLCETDLSGSFLSGANLSGANLSGANLDYASWPLNGGSIDVKIDSRIAEQLVYHTIRACMSVDGDEDIKAFCASPSVIRLANRFRRVDEYGKIGDGGMVEEKCEVAE